jgi:glycerophosphoryl diester phosphodiesterase
MLRKRFVLDAHAHGLQLFVYGVNTARHLIRPRRFGADGIITNYPERMLRLLGRSPVRHFPAHSL